MLANGSRVEIVNYAGVVIATGTVTEFDEQSDWYTVELDRAVSPRYANYPADRVQFIPN